MVDRGSVMQMAGSVHVGLCITATLDPEKFQRVFENGIENGRMHVERGGGVFPDDDEIFALFCQARKIGLGKLFGPALRFEIIDGVG